MLATASSTANPESPRIMLVTDSKEPSGVGEHMIALALTLQHDARISLVFSDTPSAQVYAERARKAGFAVSVVPAPVLIEGRREFAAVLEQHRPDLVHVHAGINWEGHGLAAAARESRGASLALVRTEHLPYVLRAMGDPALDAAYAKGVQPVDRIICVCEAARRTFRMSYADQRRYSVVRNGVMPQPATRTREAVRAELGTGNDRLILTVGRFTRQKRHATLLDAMPALLASHPDVRLVWAGTGPMEAELLARAQAAGMAGRILFLGRRCDIPDLMAAADLFCLPSFFEGHPLVVLEAMAAGLPVVATRSLGITEAVRNGETGLLVPLDNAPALGAALNRLLADPALAQRLGAAGRTVFREQFPAQRMARDTLAIYRHVLAPSMEHPCARPDRPPLFTSAGQVSRIHETAQRLSFVVPFGTRKKRLSDKPDKSIWVCADP